jgi:hypothetical protein
LPGPASVGKLSLRVASVYSFQVFKGLPLCLLSLVLLSPSLAHADEGESALSLNAAFAGFSVPDHSPAGGSLGFDYERGITDILWIRASAGGAVFADGGSPAYGGYSEVGITYVIDILRYVPYINLGVGGVYLQVEEPGDDFENGLKPLISVGAGVDLLTERGRSYGLFTRYESFLGRSAFFLAGARMSWRWGFF